MNILTALGGGIALLTIPGTIELLVLSLFGWLPPRKSARAGTTGYRLAVVVPSHNEELNIAGCVRSLAAADCTGIALTIAVVADNCTDKTAAVAAAAGARVLIRNNKERRGKGYALDYAFGVLMPEGFDGFVVVDADSSVSANLLTATVSALSNGADATQCRYIVRNRGDSVRTRLLGLALLAFNVLRPRGRDRLGLSCGIYGNGFGLSAATLQAVPYTAESVVEDLEFHLALVRAGKRVRFVDEAIVSGDMPTAGAGVKTQRARWEGGRFRMIAQNLPSLVGEILRGRWMLAEPCLDLALLPLTFHIVLLLLAVLTPFWFARGAGVIGLSVVVFHLLAAVGAGGGTWREVVVLGVAPFYVIWKLLLIPRLLASSRSGAAWVRTERTGETRIP